MADQHPGSPGESPQEATETKISVGVDVELSDADLDAAISEEDPEFLKKVDEVGQDKTLSISQIILTEGEQALNAEKEMWAHSGKLGKFLYKVVPFLPHLSLRFKKIKIWIFDFIRGLRVRATNLLSVLFVRLKKDVIGGTKHFISAKLEALSEAQRNFRYLSWKLKLAFFGILILMGFTVFFIYRSLTHGVIPLGKGLFIKSIEEISSHTYDYDPEQESEVEPLYENLRSSSNIVLIPRMVVNLKKSAHSGDNPMGAFEFYLEGMVSEVVIEVKDRETEIRDRMQRVVEEFTFDMAESPEGKRFICERLKKDINGILTTGKLKKVWLKTVIVKP